MNKYYVYTYFHCSNEEKEASKVEAKNGREAVEMVLGGKWKRCATDYNKPLGELAGTYRLKSFNNNPDGSIDKVYASNVTHYVKVEE